MATAEILRDTSLAVTVNAAPLVATAIQGSTQFFQKSNVESPTLFVEPTAPGVSGGLYSAWESVKAGPPNWVFMMASNERHTTEWPSTLCEDALRWDRVRLELMRIASLVPNWDGEGADPVSPNAVKQAGILLQSAKNAAESAELVDYPLPTIYAALDGGVTLKWTRAGKELKCTAYGDQVEVIRWRSPEVYEADGFWEIPVTKIGEHFDWLLR